MALDFGSYLLSSSPPGFEYIRLKPTYEFAREDVRDFPHCKKTFDDDDGDVTVNGFVKFDIHSERCRRNEELAKTHWSNDQLVDDRTKVPNQRCTDNSRISDWENSYHCDPRTCHCHSTKIHGKVKTKHVTFADDRGQMLTEIRVMQEPSDVPPQLKLDILNQFESSEPSSIDLPSDATPCLLINFAQPAANYPAFREKLEKNFVSLENARVKDNQIFGTIKVKNLSFDKQVSIRCTFDDWLSYRDFSAAYSNSNSSCYDTFSFQIEVPSSVKPENSVHFAVCFRSDGVEYWDNNNGKNYEITCSHWSRNLGKSQNSSARGVFAMDRQDSWSDFSGWAEEHENPYW